MDAKHEYRLKMTGTIVEGVIDVMIIGAVAVVVFKLMGII